MKKLIFILFTATLIVMSFLSIKQFEYMQFQNFNYTDNLKNWNIIIDSGNSDISKIDNFKLLNAIAKDSKVNIQRKSFEKNSDGEDKLIYYVSLYDEKEYFKKINLVSGEFIDIDSNSNEFISTVQKNSKDQIGKIELFHSFDPIEFRPMLAAEKKRDLKGTYTIVGNEEAKRFEEFALKAGFSLYISKEQSESLYSPYPYKDLLYKSTLILCLLFMLAIYYDITNNYKEIAVRLLFGSNFINIGIHLLKRYITLLISSLFFVSVGLVTFLYFYNHFQEFQSFALFWLNYLWKLSAIVILIMILAWLGTWRINIPDMIKNKKTLKLNFFLTILIRFILAIFLVLGLVQGLSTYKELKTTTDNQENWSVLKDYSYLGVTASPDLFVDFSNDQEKRDRFTSFYKELIYDGAIFISPSSFYMYPNQPSLDGLNEWGMYGRKVEINRNYLSVNPIYDPSDKQVKLEEPNQNEINVLVPEKYLIYEKVIIETLEEDYHGMYNMNNPKPVTINITYVKDGQSYFSFTTKAAIDNHNKIVDPVAVLVNHKTDPAILANSISMGYGFFTKNYNTETPFKNTQRIIDNYDFTDIWEPASVAYADVENKLANDREKLSLVSIYCVIYILLAATLLFFSVIYYLESNKQLLAIQWVFGFNFYEKHYLVYLFLLVFWNLSFMIAFFQTQDSLLLLKTIVGLTTFDFILISIFISLKEYRITKNVLIEK